MPQRKDGSFRPIDKLTCCVVLEDGTRTSTLTAKNTAPLAHQAEPKRDEVEVVYDDDYDDDDDDEVEESSESGEEYDRYYDNDQDTYSDQETGSIAVSTYIKRMIVTVHIRRKAPITCGMYVDATVQDLIDRVAYKTGRDAWDIRLVYRRCDLDEYGKTLVACGISGDVHVYLKRPHY